MFHVVFSIASRFLHLGNMLQGFARGIFALRNLQIISSHLLPAPPAPSPALLLDAPVAFVEFPEKIISPYSSAIIAIEPQHSVFSSSIPSYQSSLITVMPSQLPSQLPNLVPLFIMLAIIIISGSIVLLPLYLFVNIAKNTSAIAHSSKLFAAKSLNAKPIFNLVPAGLPCQLPSFQLLISLFSLLLLWTGPPAIAFFFTLIWVISSLFSPGQSLDMIVTILQRCGLLTIQDTQTPPFLTAIYEQITHTTEYNYRDLAQCEDLSNEHKNGQVITDSSPGYSHLATRLGDHGSNPRNALAPRKSSQRDAWTRELEAERRRLRVEHIHAKLSNSQRILRQQLEALRAREEKSRADPVIEKGCQKSEVLVSASEASDKERRRWEQLAATAKALCAEAENTAFKLQVDLTAAMDRNRDIQEKLDHQLTLASDNAHVVQSIMEGSQVAHTKLKCAEDKIARLENELQQEKDRRPCETKEILDEQGHDAEIRRVAAAQEPRSTREKIAALRHLMSQLRDELSRPDDARPPKYRPRPRTGLVDTGQPPRPPERLLDAPLPPATSPSSPLYSIKSPRHSPSQDSRNPSSYPTACLLQISACFGQPPDDVAKAQRAALEELIQRMREPESESTPDAKPSERDRARLEEELVEAKEQLRLAGEEALNVRRDLDQSIEVLIEVETYARGLEDQLVKCLARLREAQGSRRANLTKLDEAVELLNLRNAELETSLAEAEASQFRCSQVSFLSAALQERVTELEAEVKKLKSTQQYSAIPAANTDSRLSRPTDTDLETIIPEVDLQVFDSVYMIIPSSLLYLPDLSLPPSSLQPNDIPPYFCHERSSAIGPAFTNSSWISPADTGTTHNADSQISNDSIYMALPSFTAAMSQVESFLLDVSLPHPSPSEWSDIALDITRQEVSLHNAVDLDSTDHEPANLCLARRLPLHLSSEGFLPPPFRLPRSFLSDRNSVASMDWPPIGPALFLADENYLQDEGIGVQENADNSIPTRKPSLPPVEKSDWTYPDHSPLVSPIISHSSLDCSPARVLDGREFSHSVAAHAEASKTIADSCTPGPVVPDDDLSAQSLPQTKYTPDSSILPPASSLVSALAVSDRRRDILSTLDPDASWQNCSGVTGIPTNLASRYAPLQPFHIRRQPPLVNPELPVFSKFTLPPVSLPPAAFHKRQNVTGHPGTMIDSVSRDPLCNSPLNSAPNHVFHPTGTLSSQQADNDFETSHDGTLSPRVRPPVAPVAAHISVKTRDDSRVIPAPRESLLALNLPGNGSITSTLTSSLLNPREVPRPLRNVLKLDGELGQRVPLDHPELTLWSRRSSYLPCASSGLTPPGSPPPPICISVNIQAQGVSTQNYREVLASQSDDVATAQSGLAPKALLPPPNHFSATTPRTNGPSVPDHLQPPLPDWDPNIALNAIQPAFTQLSSAPVLPLVGQDVYPRAVERIAKSRAQLPHLLPGLPELVTIDSDDRASHEVDSIRISERVRKGHRHDRIPSRPRDIPKLDYGLPGDFVPGSGRVAPERPDPDLDDFAYIIPLDCPTSTPVASQKRCPKKVLRAQ